MTSIDTAFTRLPLSKMHADVRAAFPEIPDLMKAASTTRTMRNQFFVQIETPCRPMFECDVEAFDAYDARFKAWGEFMRKYGPAEDAA